MWISVAVTHRPFRRLSLLQVHEGIGDLVQATKRGSHARNLRPSSLEYSLEARLLLPIDVENDAPTAESSVQL